MANNPRDSEKFVINQQYFQGGATTDYKMGVANSYLYSKNLDNRTFPSQISTLPASRQINGNLKDLITAMQQDLDGNRWGIGDAGWLYKIDTSDNVSIVDNIGQNGSAGMLYSRITDTLYIPGTDSVTTYGKITSGITGNPVIRKAHFGKSASIAPGCTALYNTSDGLFDSGYIRNDAQTVGLNTGITSPSQIGNPYATNTYTLPTTIIENTTNFCFFAPDIEPFYSIAVYVASIGTGDWTLTLHDSLNDDLATVTITNANMVTGWNEFVFSGQIRALVNASQTGISPTYHFHLTSSVTGDTATANVITTGDLSTANFLLFAYRLVDTTNGWHPTAYFTGTGQPILCIGNGEYLSTYNFSNDANPTNGQWQRHALTFTPGEEVCGITTSNQYLVVATEIRSNDYTRNVQGGRLYFWDGSTNSPNMFIDIPMGAPYGLGSLNSITYFVSAGGLYAWSGGITQLKVRKLAYQNTDYLNAVDNTRVYPNSTTSRYGILMMGYPGTTSNVNLQFGIWSWGTVELTYPNSYALSYTQSPDILNYSTSNNYKLGCVVNFVDAMYSSWQYTDSSSVTHYGLDVVDNFSTPALSASYESLIFDGGVVYKQKMAVRFKISCLPIPTGMSLVPKFKIDRNASWTYISGTTATAGATEAFMELNNSRFHELQWGFDMVNDGTATAPIIVTSVAPEIDPNQSEVDLLPGEV